MLTKTGPISESRSLRHELDHLALGEAQEVLAATLDTWWDQRDGGRECFRARDGLDCLTDLVGGPASLERTGGSRLEGVQDRPSCR